jgi:kynurenine formamidase
MTNDNLTNWGRWGPDDERGTLNLLTADNIRLAAGLVRQGKAYSLMVDLDKNGPVAQTRNPLWHRTSVTLRPTPQHSSADDVVVMHTHGTTHVDALCHVFYQNQMYNGYRVDEEIHPTSGSKRNGVHNIGSLIGRGVLLDIAGHRGVEHLQMTDEIGPDELDACAASQGVEIMPGDIVLVRTGWYRVFLENRELFESGSPGPNGDVVAWFNDHEICAMGADNVAVESTVGKPRPLHLGVIRDLGGYLLEFLFLEELAADKVYEFMFVATPLKLINGIGSPINPVAIC